ncbi:MAG: hypothetical protein EA350_06170 [Gemmatimonadales bacterium]|nr:MAG: hypothetical protein EA350_06170 [Gemmatimonadales bacterium]
MSWRAPEFSASPFPVPTFPSRPAPWSLLAAGTVLLLVLPGCGGFDRGPGGTWDELSRGGDGERFEPGMVEGLPEPARRFLLQAIEPGTPLARSVDVSMEGTIVLDPERDPLPMLAVQVLSPPDGFIWSARTTGGLMRIRGYDRYSGGEGEMRWKLFGVIPVMRATGPDVTRSAAARMAMEGVMVPSWLVPREGAEPAVRWEDVDGDHARFVVTVAGERVATTVRVDAEGRPLRAWADRWNEGKYERFQVEFDGEFQAGGYRLPGVIEAGWRLGDPDEFRFFRARLTGVTFR